MSRSFDEALVRGDLVGGHARDFVDDLAEAVEDLLVSHSHLVVFSFVVWSARAARGRRDGRGQGTVMTCAA